MNDGTDVPEELDLDHLEVEDSLEIELAGTLDELRRAFVAPVDPDVASTHLAAMFAAADNPVVPLRRRGKVLAAAGLAAGVVVATGGLAAARVLPEPVQRIVATAASPLGIHLPDGSSLRPSSPDGDGNQTGPIGGGGTSDHAPASDRSPTSTEPGPPGNSENAPGHGGENPGNSDNAPGQLTNPGNSENAPGQGGPTNGNWQNAPGQGGPSPSNPGNAGGNGGGQGNNDNKPPVTTPAPTRPSPTTPTTPPPPTTPTTKAKTDQGGKKN